MRYLAAVMFLHLAGAELGRADEFMAAITKIDGNKITLTKFSPLPLAETTLTAADSCVVAAQGKYGTKKLEPGDLVEGSIKNKLFRTATVIARIVTEEDKVTVIGIFAIQPDNDIWAILKKIDGKKMTFTRLGFKKGDDTLIIADNVMVNGSHASRKSLSFRTLEGGLKNDIFKREGSRMRLLLADNNKIIQIDVSGPLLPK